MWKLSARDDIEKRLKKLRKSNRREVENLYVNLGKFLRALELGAHPQQIKRGFIHPEPHGVLAIDQSGKGSHLRELRLYIYPDVQTQTLHQFTIGDKKTQSEDIKLCRQYVDEILASGTQQEDDLGDAASGQEERA